MRPAFPGDLRYVAEALHNEFGDGGIEKLLKIEEGSVFLNRAPFIDDMKEVVVGGVVVGRLYFDIESMKWRWRLSEASAQLLVDCGKLGYVVRDRVRPLEIVKQGGSEGEQLPVVRSSGELIALAVSRRGFFRVQKIFREDPGYPIDKTKASLSDILRANEYWLRRLISLASSKAYSISYKLQKPLIASYSGGKDSLVALHLCLEVGIEPKVIFNDTGLELPETINNVFEVSKRFGLALDYIDSGDSFWRAVSTFGPPAKDYRWCCKVVKLVPIARYYRKYYPEGALVIVGQRAYESLRRYRSGYLWRNKWLPSVLNMSPIQAWDQLSEWLYILKHRLPYNTLYYEGFDRLGCYLCPAANIAEYCLIQKLHPELWDAWTRELSKWQETTNQPPEWVKYHLWRWLRRDSPGRLRIVNYLRVAGVTEGTPADCSTPLRGNRTNISARHCGGSLILESAHYDLTEPVISQRAIMSLLIDGSGPDGAIKLVKTGKGSSTRILLSARKAVIEGSEAAETAYDLVKLVSRWYKCIRCGNCSFWCPRGATSVTEDRPKVNQKTCTSCRVCLEVCPIASVYVDKVERYKLGLTYKPKKKSEARLVLELYRELNTKTSERYHDSQKLDSLESLNFFLELE